MLDSEGGAERAVRARVAAVWGKWREIAGVLLNKFIPLAWRGMVFDAYCGRNTHFRQIHFGVSNFNF